MTLQEMRDYYAGMSNNEENTDGHGSSEQTVNYMGDADAGADAADGGEQNEGYEPEKGQDKDKDNMSIRYVRLFA